MLGARVAFLAGELAVGMAVGAAGALLLARGAWHAHRLSNGLFAGLRVISSQFGPIAVKAVLLAALVARLIASTLATSGACAAGMRGAAGRGAVILATFAVIDEVPRGVELVNTAFFAVRLSAALQGAAVQTLAARFWSQGKERLEGERPLAVRPGRPAAAPSGDARARTGSPSVWTQGVDAPSARRDVRRA
ncbi:MAG: hypothetical protein ACRDNK_13130 [Solirubrobacteraceae bacterium]